MDFLDPNNSPARGRVDPSGALTVGHGTTSVLGLSAATVLDQGPGRVARISILTASASAGAVYDSNSTSGNSATNQIAVIPANAAVGTVITLDWPYSTGLVISPGAGGVLAVTYNP